MNRKRLIAAGIGIMVIGILCMAPSRRKDTQGSAGGFIVTVEGENFGTFLDFSVVKAELKTQTADDKGAFAVETPTGQASVNRVTLTKNTMFPYSRPSALQKWWRDALGKKAGYKKNVEVSIIDPSVKTGAYTLVKLKNCFPVAWGINGMKNAEIVPAKEFVELSVESVE